MKCQSNFFLCSTQHCWGCPDWCHWPYEHGQWHRVGTVMFPQVHAAPSEGPSSAQCVPAAPPSHPAATMLWGLPWEPSLKLPLPMNIIVEKSNQTPRSWCHLLPKAGSRCMLRATHSQLYPHEIFLEKKLYSLSRQSDLSLTLCGNLFELPKKPFPRATAGQLCLWDRLWERPPLSCQQ